VLTHLSYRVRQAHLALASVLLVGTTLAGTRPASAGSVLTGPRHCPNGDSLLCHVSADTGGSHPRGPSGDHSTGPGAAAPDLDLPDCAVLAGAQECMNLQGLPEVAPHVGTADLAAMAMDQVALPAPRAHTNPARRSWVGLRTYLWIDGRLWHPYRASAAVPGQTVTLTARPTHVVWELGEASIQCAGPGTPYRPGRTTPSTDPCGYEYRRSSARTPDGSYDVIATVFYTAEWTCTGSCDTASGTEGPLPATGRTRLRVGEIQTATTTGG
jgi:hypothetical protein